MAKNEVVVLNQGVIGNAVGIRIEKEIDGVGMGRPLSLNEAPTLGVSGAHTAFA